MHPSRIHSLFLTTLFALCGHPLASALAQCDTWKPGFELAGTSNRVNTLATFDDGTGPVLAIGGFFDSAGPTLAGNIVAWDGTSFRPLGSGVYGEVHSLCVFDDGTGPALYVGGNFAVAGGVAASCIAKWNGTAWSALGTGLGSYVYALAVYDDGTGPALYAGGAFTTATGAPGNYLARWNGSSWSALASPIGGIVRALCTFDDGSGPALFAAGFFDTAGGNSASRIARWNGSTWSALGSGVDMFIHALCVHDDGTGPQLYAGGNFFFAGGVLSQYVARWNGSIWSGVGFGVDEEVYALTSYDDGSGAALYAGTQTAATNMDNHPRRWDGSNWTELPNGLSPTTTQSLAIVRAFAAFDEGTGQRLIAGGWFGKASGLSANNLAGWDGSAWKRVGHGAGIGEPFGSSFAAAGIVFDDGTGPGLYVGGYFTSAGDTVVQNVARWKNSEWTRVGEGLTDNLVHAFAVFDDGGGKRLYAAGSFTTIGGVDANHIAKWTGSEWERLDSGLNGHVNALAVFDDGSGPQLYAGGQFALAGGQFAVALARWNGSEWSGVDTGLFAENFVTALCVFDDGSGPRLYVGGGFGGDGAYGLRYLARWNGGSSWTNVGTPPNNDVFALVTLDDGSGSALYAGGSFFTAGGITVNHVAKWNGSTWSALGSGTSSTSGSSDVFTLAAFDDGSGPELYAGGNFMSAGGVSVNKLASWDGSAWSALGAGVGGSHVRDLVVFEDGTDGSPDLFALGAFSQAGPLPALGVPSYRIAQWRGCGRPGVRVCNGDGSVAGCPCGNTGLAGRGCENSASTGGATLLSAGWTSLEFDSLVLTSSHELPSALSIFLQGNLQISPASFGDGLRCAGGSLKRLYSKNASGGIVSAPTGAEPKVSVRSATLGDPIAVGTNRVYQVYYRDPNLSFCPSPAGNTWNVSNGLRIGWLP